MQERHEREAELERYRALKAEEQRRKEQRSRASKPPPLESWEVAEREKRAAEQVKEAAKKFRERQTYAQRNLVPSERLLVEAAGMAMLFLSALVCVVYFLVCRHVVVCSLLSFAYVSISPLPDLPLPVACPSRVPVGPCTPSCVLSLHAEW